MILHAVPMDSNVAAKEIEKIGKYAYKNLSLELTSLWKMKCTVIPLVFLFLFEGKTACSV